MAWPSISSALARNPTSLRCHDPVSVTAALKTLWDATKNLYCCIRDRCQFDSAELTRRIRHGNFGVMLYFFDFAECLECWALRNVERS